MSYMGMGTNILGYSNTKIDSCVKDVITKGNLSTLNASGGSISGKINKNESLGFTS